MKSHKSPIVIYLLILVYFAAVSFVSHIPGDQLSLIDVSMSDKIAHVLEYIPLGFLFALLYQTEFTWETGKKMAFGVLFIALLATLDECHQYFVPGRCASFLDGIADVVGGILGMGCAYLYQRIRSKGATQTELSRG